MEHHHHHHHHHHKIDDKTNKKTVRIYWLSIIFNLLFVGVEACIGIYGNSLGLIADAGHNLGDVFSLLLALIAVHLSTTHGTERFTYGFRKSSILISLLNAIILLIAVGGIAVESVRRLIEIVQGTTTSADGELISWTAGIGIVVNGLTAWMLSRCNKDINQRGAYLHMLADTLVSVGVVIAGIVIAVTDWTMIDPVISLVIAGIILWSTWGLLAESIRMSIDAVPEGVNMNEVREWIQETAGVINVHHLHVWAISTSETALTAHVVIDNKERLEAILKDIKLRLIEHNISHSTLEVETEMSECQSLDC